MKEHPILFSGPMVRAILDGRKTQTRRIVKRPASAGQYPFDDGMEWAARNPYGQPGDRLWVRETFRASASDPKEIHYAASVAEYDRREKGPWKPSIHMPRWASRIILEVVSVRVERLQQITSNDAVCEGFDGWKDPAGQSPDVEPWEEFRTLWDQINAKRAPWSSNPWVWAIEFRRVR